MKVVVAAAGTGGHINPALSIIEKIQEKQENPEILFIGTTYGLENTLVPKKNIPLKQIEAYGMKKELSLKNISNIFKTMVSSKYKVKKILKEFQPDVVIGTGGYVCVPVFQAATQLKIPTVLHESNAYPGLAISLFKNKATRILTGFEDTLKYFPNDNAYYVGNPTKIKKIDYTPEQRAQILEELGLSKDKKTIFVFGGSQGAVKINEAIVEYVKEILKENKEVPFQIILASGLKNYDHILEQLGFDKEKEEKGQYTQNIIRVFPYIYEMEKFLNVCDVVISRAGAMTVCELSKVQKSAIFIPLPSVNANKQEDNAKVFENAGCGIIIPNAECNKDTIKKAIEEVFEGDTLEIMNQNVKKISQDQDVLESIYEHIERITNFEK